MEWLQSLLDNSTMPALTAFLLGLLTALSPCPLATNIAAIGFIGKDIEDRHRIFRNGLLYTLGRVIAYTVLALVLIAILKEGSSLFGIQRFIGKYGEMVLGPVLCIIGLFMLFGDKLPLPSFGFKGNGEGMTTRLLRASSPMNGLSGLWVEIPCFPTFSPRLRVLSCISPH